MDLHAAQAQLAFRALRSASCLHTHAAAFAFTPEHLEALALAAADLVSAHAAALAAPAPLQPATTPPLPAPLSPYQPLQKYLEALPTQPLALPPLPLRGAALHAKDASLAQVAKDVERDIYLVNGRLLQGAALKFDGVLQATCQAAAEALRAARAGGDGGSSPAASAALEAAVARALQLGSRTTSGGDAFEAAALHLGLPPPQQPPRGAAAAAPLPLLLAADSRLPAAPVTLHIEPAPALRLAGCAAAEPAAAAQRALRALLRAHPNLLPPGCSSEQLGAAAAWACCLQPGLRLRVAAATSYLLLLEGEAAGAEPRVVARLQAVFSQGLTYGAASAQLEPCGAPTVTLCREAAPAEAGRGAAR
jgi:hypothetical protein